MAGADTAGLLNSCMLLSSANAGVASRQRILPFAPSSQKHGEE
jgi:hypothetical protein